MELTESGNVLWWWTFIWPLCKWSPLHGPCVNEAPFMAPDLETKTRPLQGALCRPPTVRSSNLCVVNTSSWPVWFHPDVKHDDRSITLCGCSSAAGTGRRVGAQGGMSARDLTTGAAVKPFRTSVERLHRRFLINVTEPTGMTGRMGSTAQILVSEAYRDFAHDSKW